MDRKVYILHSSAIIQEGLSTILNKEFNCRIKSYLSLSSFIEDIKVISGESIIFAEDEIANSEEFLEFLNKYENLESFSIINSKDKEYLEKSPQNILLYGSSDELLKQIRHIFEDTENNKNNSEDLTNREIDVLKLIALGHSNKEIAEKLFISTHTVMSHRKNITEKLGIKSISGLTVYAIINNHIDTTNLDINALI